jgi:hypothetical protein
LIGAVGACAAVVSKRDGRRHIVVLCASEGATLRWRNCSLGSGVTSNFDGVVASKQKPPAREADGRYGKFDQRQRPTPTARL